MLAPADFIAPCLPSVSRFVPAGPQWVYEIKHDGFRFICRRAGDRVRVYSRSGKDWTDRVPRIVAAMMALPVGSATIDGEGVVCRTDGVTDFELLRAAVGSRGSGAAFLYAFDLLERDGRDLRGLPWARRRDALAALLPTPSSGLQLCEHISADGQQVFRQACAMGLEGIVAKRRDSAYRSGRSRDWIKIKNPAAPAAARAILIVESKRRAATRR